ncbi:MAG: hypothetical protein ACTSYA_02835 [Candidatus Kariarchaeaceae archaeon]
MIEIELISEAFEFPFLIIHLVITLAVAITAFIISYRLRGGLIGKAWLFIALALFVHALIDVHKILTEVKVLQITGINMFLDVITQLLMVYALWNMYKAYLSK